MIVPTRLSVALDEVRAAGSGSFQRDLGPTGRAPLTKHVIAQAGIIRTIHTSWARGELQSRFLLLTGTGEILLQVARRRRGFRQWVRER